MAASHIVFQFDRNAMRDSHNLHPPDAVEEEEWEPACDEAAHDEPEDERGPPLLLPRHPLPLALALLRRRHHHRSRPGRRRLSAVVPPAPAALEAVQLRGRGLKFSKELH